MTRGVVGLFLVAVLGTTWLKALCAARWELWLDETHSALLTGMPLPQVLHFLRGDQYPPLYFVLLQGWARVFSAAPEALRWSSILTSLAGAGLASALGSRVLGGRGPGALCGLLFLCSPALFSASLEVRAYMLAVSLVLLVCLIGWDLRKAPSAARAAAFGLAGAACFYTHYLTLVPVGVLFAFLFFEGGRRHRLALLFAATVILVAASPWLPALPPQVAATRSLRTDRQAARSNPDSLNYEPHAVAEPRQARLVRLARSQVSLLGAYPADSRSWLLALAIPLLLLAGTWGWLAVRGDPVVLVFLAVSLANLACLLFFLRLEHRRYLLVSAPFLILAVARAVLYLSGERRLRPVFWLVALGIPVVWCAGTLRAAGLQHAQPIRAVVSELSKELQPWDRVVFNSLWIQVPVEYHARHLGLDLRRAAVGFPLSIYDWWDRQPSKEWGGPVILRQDLVRFVDALVEESRGRVWLVVSDNEYYDPQNQLLRALEGKALRVVEYPIPSSRLSESYRLYRIDLSRPRRAMRG